MSTRAFAAAACVTIVGGAPLGAACQNLETRSREIVLRGFSDSAYVELNRGMGAPVCIRGRISIDTAGVYFALRPIEDGDIIDVGFSRILLSLSSEQARRNNMVNGRRYRLCGTLRDATPFRQCDHDHCKWYELQNAELQRGGERPRGQDVRRFANRALGGTSLEDMNHDRNGDGRAAAPAFSGTPGTHRGDAVLAPGEIGRVQEEATVSVRGYLVFGSHARQLWSSRRAAENNDIENCVTLVNTLPLREQLSQRSRTVVTITGRAFRDVLSGRVDMGACSQVGLLVERVENRP